MISDLLTAPVYEYETLPLRQVCEVFQFCEHPDTYLAEEPITIEIRRLLKHGFRWVRSEGDFAVFERVSSKIPDQLKHSI